MFMSTVYFCATIFLWNVELENNFNFELCFSFFFAVPLFATSKGKRHLKKLFFYHLQKLCQKSYLKWSFKFSRCWFYELWKNVFLRCITCSCLPNTHTHTQTNRMQSFMKQRIHDVVILAFFVKWRARTGA